jgi:tetratricopeptide (TPR) repeat protein
MSGKSSAKGVKMTGFGQLLVVSLLLLSTSPSAQSGMIRGKVRTSNGVTINSALVELKQATGGVIAQFNTRNDGDFEFVGLRAGEYEVLVTAGGFESARQVVKLNENNTRVNPAAAINEIVSIEIIIQPRQESSIAPPGTSFIQDVPKPARASYEKGIAKLREGKVEEGTALLQDATAQFNNYFDAHFALGFQYYLLGRDKEALESLERARLINDRGASVYYVFGLVMVREQKFHIAEYAFGKSAELNANHVASHFNHAVALIEVALRSADPREVKSSLAGAERELDRAWELSSNHLNTVFLQRARVFEKQGNVEAAANELERYVKAEPDAKNVAQVRQKIEALRANR